MKKRILSLVLALSMMISLFPVSALAQTPGGGTAEMAEENGETEETAGTITIDSSGEPVISGLHTDSEGYWVGNGWKYMDGAGSGLGTLTLMSGTWNLAKQNAVKCYVAIDEKATVAGGTFENTVWNQAGGKISGGTFKETVSNKGTITGGIFVGVNSESTSVINYDTGKITGGVFENNVTNGDSGDEGISASITGGLFKAKVQNKAASAAITGGVFVTKPTGSGTIANGYTLTTRGKTSKFVYAANGKEIDLGQSVYVIPNNTDTLKVACDGVSNWDVADGSDTYALTNWDGVMLKSDGSFTLNPDKISGTTLTFTVSTTPVTLDPELVLADGVPDTSEEHAKQKTADGKTIYYGNGWTYDGETLTLNPTEEKTFDLSCNGSYLKCELEVGEKATVKGWIFLSRPVENHGVIDGPKFHTEGNGYSGYPTLTNYGTVRNCYVDYGYVTNNGTMENVSFVCCKRLTNNAGATIKNAIIRTDDRNGKMSYSNSGKIDEAVFDFSPSGEQKVHVLKASSGETVGATLSGIKAVVFGTEVYIVGEPEVKVKISGSNKETITDVNGKTTYGGLTVGKDSEGFQKFIVQEKDKELVLNQIGAPDPSEVKHTLTLVNAELVDMTGTEFTENATIKIKPKFTDEELELDCWSSETTGFDVSLIQANEDGTYTLKMPGNALKLTANGRKKAYSLTVVNGVIGDGHGTENGEKYAKNAEITLTQKVPENKEFTGWELSDGLTLVDGYELTNTTIKVTMPGHAATAKATYEDKVPTTYTLTVDGGHIGTDENQTSGNYEAGATIKLTAKDAAEGEQFEKWELTGLTLKNGYQETNATIEVTITGNATAKTTYKDKVPTTYTLTVDGGYIGDDETKASGDYEAGATIKLTAKAKTGYHFTKWTVKEGTLSLSEEKLKANPLTFEMPDGAVSLKANYEEDTPDPVDPNPTPNPDDQPKTYTITTDIYGEVNGGASATVKENDWVHMTVAEVPEGMTFDCWNIPDALLKALQKQNSGFRNNVESLSFQMPNMGEEEQTFAIKANFRSSELPGEDDGPSTLGTMATVAVGGAAAGILVWQGVSLGVDSYLQLNLPKGVAVPANRRELVVLLWETAGKPEAALPSLYSDVPAEEIELQKATRWAIGNGLVKPADDSDASRFDPDRYVTKYDVFGAWLKLKKMMK